MEQWLGYSLQDVILFSAETYWRLFERHNTALWPLPIISEMMGAGMLAAVVFGQRWSGTAACLAFALAWAFIGQAFLRGLYEPINWTIVHVIPAFWLQAVLLLVFCRKLTFGTGRLRTTIAAVLALVALAYPVAAVIAGRPFVQSEVLGIAPDPTAVATLAILILATPGWCRLLLSLIPAVWLALSAATLLTMDASTGWIPLGALALALVALTLPSTDIGEHRS